MENNVLTSDLLNGFQKISIKKNLPTPDEIFITAYESSYVKKSGETYRRIKLVSSKVLTGIIKKEKYQYLDIYYNKETNKLAYFLSKTESQTTNIMLNLKIKARFELTNETITKTVLQMFGVPSVKELMKYDKLPWRFPLIDTNYEKDKDNVVFIF